MTHPTARASALLSLCLLPLLSAALPTAGGPARSAPATRPATRPTTTLSGPARWEKEVAAYEAADRKNPPATGGIVFTGSSTIRRWTTLQADFAGLPVLNRGFGGSMLSDAVYFADRLVVPYKPRVVVLYSGCNDLNANRKPEQVFADYKAFVAKVHAKLPETRIVFMGIGPSPKRWLQADRQRRANQMIRDYVAAADEHMKLQYVEIWDEMLGTDGNPREDLFVADHLHNNPAGYQIRAAILRPLLALN